ncbi:MAG: F0F1 ATP synthase subunit alpha [Candidatus Paceibacterota bacterium]|jgi:F-type H+-transporting ATPase subunit alpha
MSKESIIEAIKSEIKNIKTDKEIAHVGVVSKFADGVATVRGLSEVRYNEMIEFTDSVGNKVLGVALNLEEDSVGAILLGDGSHITEGSEVKSTGRILSIQVGDDIIGRVIGGLAAPKDGKPAIKAETSKTYPLETIAPGVITRQSVDQPMHTGIKAIDAMIPIGRGQRQLIIGDRTTGKTAIAIDAIIHQKREKNPPVCVYVAIGQKESKVAQIVEKLRKEGAMDYTIVVSAAASDPAALQYLAPFTGCAIAEYFRDKGQDVLIVYDDLSKHAWAYRQISLLLKRPPGREAYPGDVFYLHSRLLERAGRLNKEFGGGSITALPLIETQLNDISAYIPTNVISITDGQIFLETELFFKGIRPAINVGLSVSRVGSAAQTKLMKKVSGGMKLDLAQFRSLEAFAQFGSDLDAATKKQIDRGRRLTELLKQVQYTSQSFEEQAIAIYAAGKGFLDNVSVEKVREYEKGLIAFLKERYTKLLETLRAEAAYSEVTEPQLKDAITDYTTNYFGK